jgi:Na+/H+-dicarboxylate symporter
MNQITDQGHRGVVPRIIFWNLSAIVLGVACGIAGGPSTASLGLIAWIPIAIIKGLASPLLFLAILHGLMNEQMSGRGVRQLLVTCAVNAAAGVAIAVILVNSFRPGDALTPLVRGVMAQSSTAIGAGVNTTTWSDAVKGLVPDSVLGPFVQNNIPAILVLALLFGFAARALGRVTEADGIAWAPWFHTLRSGVEHGLGILGRMMAFVMRLMPLAIFASVAKATGEQGLAVFAGLGWYVAICVGGLLLQILIVYQGWIIVVARTSLGQFWRHARLPVLYAFGVNSSLAALPATLNALDDLKVSPGASRLGACVGTNFNNDGILLYEVAALLMLGQAAGFDWSLSHQLGLAGVCVLATLGVSGFPEAGVIALSLVLTSAGLPVELLPLLLPVDWLVARVRSATNVVSDMTVSLAIDRRLRTN